MLSADDIEHVTHVVREIAADSVGAKGVGIEIRYNFNPNDSSRLRKDVALAGYLREKGLVPIYLIYSSISPRDEAIRRLTRGGWFFLQGNAASNFTTELFGTDFLALLDREDVRQEIHAEVRSIMLSIFSSTAFGNLLLKDG